MPRGGWRQQAGARSRSRSRSPTRRVPLSEGLASWMQAWAWGHRSAADLVRDAQAFVRDGHRDAGIEALAQSGGDTANSARAVRRLLPDDEGPRMELIEGGAVTMILPPAALFRWIMTKHPDKFRAHFGAARGGVEDWWAKLRASAEGRDFWAKHPMLQDRTPADLKFHVPLVLHDDAGPVSHLSAAA